LKSGTTRTCLLTLTAVPGPPVTVTVSRAGAGPPSALPSPPRLGLPAPPTRPNRSRGWARVRCGASWVVGARVRCSGGSRGAAGGGGGDAGERGRRRDPEGTAAASESDAPDYSVPLRRPSHPPPVDPAPSARSDRAGGVDRLPDRPSRPAGRQAIGVSQAPRDPRRDRMKPGDELGAVR
jgi:hypothetical protein